MKESLRLRTVRPSSGPTQICVLFVLLLVLLLCSACSSCATSIAMVTVNNAIIFDQSIIPSVNLPGYQSPNNFYYTKVLLYMQNLRKELWRCRLARLIFPCTGCDDLTRSNQFSLIGDQRPGSTYTPRIRLAKNSKEVNASLSHTHQHKQSIVASNNNEARHCPALSCVDIGIGIGADRQSLGHCGSFAPISPG